MNELDFDIVVVASKHRKALVEVHLQDAPHIINYTPDYELPHNFIPETIGMVQPTRHTNVYRCFRGHQDAIKASTKDNVLIFEDDAVPNTKEWIKIIKEASHLLNDFEMVSFHGREYTAAIYEIYKTMEFGNFLHIPNKKGTVCVHGALAYLLRKDAKEKVLSYIYNGMPIDILLVSDLSFCLLDKSPFIHDRSEGSLLDG